MTPRTPIQAQLVAGGMSPPSAARKAALFQRIDRFVPDFDPASRPILLFVPGRLEFLGKHTDYAGGRSLVCAVERGICLRAQPRADRRVVIQDVIHHLHASFDLEADLSPTLGSWEAYGMVVARRLARNFPGPLSGADIFFASDLSPAAGMSTSSALVIALFGALAAINHLDRHPAYASQITSPESLAEYLGAIENGGSFQALGGDQGVGTSGGCQDHAAILLSRPDHIVECTFTPLKLGAMVPVPAGYTFAIGVSGVIAEKTGAARARYNRIARVTETILRRWNLGMDRDDASLIAAISSSQDAHQRLRELIEAGKDAEFEQGTLLARLEQLVMESTVLIPDAIDALRRSDLPSLAATVDLSQMLAERMLENQLPETIGLARLAREQGAVTSSAFGAGFGGSVWALVASTMAEDFLARWSAQYSRTFPEMAPAAEFFLTPAGPPLLEISHGE